MPSSEGSVAYTALLHDIGLSTSETQASLAMLPGAGPSDSTQSFTNLASVPRSNFAATPSANLVQIPAIATPLEQLRALRQQLIHPR